CMTGQKVDIPLDSAVFEAHLKKLIADSTFQKQTDKAGSTDLKGSF
ncbi:MAG: hypothetical protein HN380_15310, partial [Victivallales bacterium]|nr:hypothetical protein [Victivallales bacterium]